MREGFFDQHMLVMIQGQLDQSTMVFRWGADDDRIDIIACRESRGISGGDSGEILLREREVFGLEIANKSWCAISQARKFVEVMPSVVSDADKTESDSH